MADHIRVEVVYARPDEQRLVALTLPAGSTAAAAIVQSGLLAAFPEIDLARNGIGIFSKIVKPDTVLRDRDRVEIYRALTADPKEVRRQRVADDRSSKKK
ncbi:RnfH family protein [Chitinolyticbacter albus]|uniref:RnfH family protein n=1 Tax=Chitinolyticbacter albus TaxID=2961951 RepID=UPI002109D4E3|nr:RnfH family protein [Chitinolyticbacter albus]